MDRLLLHNRQYNRRGGSLEKEQLYSEHIYGYQFSISKTFNVNSIKNGICGDGVCDIAAGENDTLDLGYKKEKICEKDCGALFPVECVNDTDCPQPNCGVGANCVGTTMICHSMYDLVTVVTLPLMLRGL